MIGIYENVNSFSYLLIEAILGLVIEDVEPRFCIHTRMEVSNLKNRTMNCIWLILLVFLIVLLFWIYTNYNLSNNDFILKWYFKFNFNVFQQLYFFVYAWNVILFRFTCCAKKFYVWKIILLINFLWHVNQFKKYMRVQKPNKFFLQAKNSVNVSSC